MGFGSGTCKPTRYTVKPDFFCRGHPLVLRIERKQ